MSAFFGDDCDDNIFQDVETFMKAMGQECIQSPVDEVPEPGTELPPHTLLYQDLVTEEYEEAKNAENLTDVVDAICDLIWDLCGFAYSFGVRPDILKECHGSPRFLNAIGGRQNDQLPRQRKARRA